MTIEDYFRQQAQQGLEQRLAHFFIPMILESKTDYEQRLQLELDVINNMGFAGYFLIVAILFNGQNNSIFP